MLQQSILLSGCAFSATRFLLALFSWFMIQFTPLYVAEGAHTQFHEIAQVKLEGQAELLIEAVKIPCFIS